MRNAFAAEVTRIANGDARVALLSGDIGNRLFDDFKRACPTRFFNCGVAEANMIGVAAGLALVGLRPITYTIAAFGTIRCLEQIRVDVAYHRLPVIVVGTGSGLAYAENGSTHICCDDVACLRTMPGMTIFCPADAIEVDACLHAALRLDGPSYLRLGKKGEPRVHPAPIASDLAHGIWLKQSGVVCILSAGTLLPVALEAAAVLESQGIPCAVCSCPVVKPLPASVLEEAFGRFRVVATVEEHGLIGGFGSSVGEWLVDRGMDSRPLVRFGVGDSHVHLSTTQQAERERAGLTATAIAARLARRAAESPSR